MMGREGSKLNHTDIQFKAFIRFVLDAMKEYRDEPDEAKKAAKLDKIIENLQKTLED